MAPPQKTAKQLAKKKVPKYAKSIVDIIKKCKQVFFFAGEGVPYSIWSRKNCGASLLDSFTLNQGSPAISIEFVWTCTEFSFSKAWSSMNHCWSNMQATGFVATQGFGWKSKVLDSYNRPTVESRETWYTPFVSFYEWKQCIAYWHLAQRWSHESSSHLHLHHYHYLPWHCSCCHDPLFRIICFMHLQIERFLCTDQRSSPIPDAEAIFEATGGKEQHLPLGLLKMPKSNKDQKKMLIHADVKEAEMIRNSQTITSWKDTAHVLQDILVRATVELDSEVHVLSTSWELTRNGVLDTTYHCSGECSDKASFREVVAILSCGDVVEQAGFAGLLASFCGFEKDASQESMWIRSAGDMSLIWMAGGTGHHARRCREDWQPRPATYWRFS